MFEICVFQDEGFSRYGMFGMQYGPGVVYWGCAMFGMWDVLNVGCWRTSSMFTKCLNHR